MSPENPMSSLMNFYVKLKLILPGIFTLLATVLKFKMLTLHKSVQM